MFTLKIAAALALLGLFPAGCAVPPLEAPPTSEAAAPAPRTWRADFSPPPAGPGNEASPPPPARAGEGTNRLTLEDAINLALSRNRRIADARDRAAGSRYTLVAARSDFEVKIAPAGTAGVSGVDGGDAYEQEQIGINFSKRFDIGTRVSVEPWVSRTADGGVEYETAAEGVLLQPLLRGLSREYNLAAVQSAEFGERTLARSVYLTRVDTMLKAVQNVYDIVRYRDILRLNEESARRLEGFSAAARAKEKAGLASPIDVYRAEINLNQARETLNVTRESYLDALDNLKILLALPLETEIEVAAPLEYAALAAAAAPAVEIALSSRVEIVQARDDLAEAERMSRVSAHAVLPQLDLALSYLRYGEDGDFSRSARFDQDNWGVSLAAEGDLWRTKEKAQFQQSLLSIVGKRRRLEELLDEIRREVLTEVRNLAKATKSIAIEEEQIRQAEGKMELARIKFAHGRANNFDLIEAERELLQAQSRLLGAVTQYIVGTYRFKAALGTMIEKPSSWMPS